jgi:DNA-binding NtrC family response regulator
MCRFGILGGMPKSRAPARTRPCLVVAQAAGDALLKMLADAGFDVDTAGTESEALAAVDRRPWALVLVSQALGDASVQAIIRRAREKHPPVPVVVLGATARLPDAIDAMQMGAADFLAPPLAPEVVAARLGKLVAASPRPREAATDVPSFEPLGLTGRSAAMSKVYASVARVSRYKANVLILGESGSGKELVARALHTLGPRRNHLFVALNCATLGRDILENELFGHERGAFTGANERKRGLFELADGGTLFLDEIAELDASTQAKLLRVLERSEFRRVGGTAKIRVDLSLIVATNRDLEEAVAAKRFREDLYYRLKVVTIVVPPLRGRREDIPALIDAFIADFNRRNDGKIKGISPQALRSLMDYDWPGNVRELKNAVESAAVMTTGETIALADFENVQLRGGTTRERDAHARPGAAGDSLSVSASATLNAVERAVIAEHLQRARTKADAARSLGIGLRTLYTKIRAHRLETRAAPRGRRPGRESLRLERS